MTQLAAPVVPSSPSAQNAPEVPVSSSRLQRGFDRLRDIADRGWSGTAVFAYGLLQSLIVPGFSDALYLPLALAQPKRAYRLAAFAVAGTIVGGTLLYLMGVYALSSVIDTIGRWTGIDAAGLQQAQELLNKWGWLLVIGSAFSPISTKLLTVSAGAFGMPYAVFMGSLAAARTVRLVVFSWAIQRFGAKAVQEALGLRVDADEETSGVTGVDAATAASAETGAETAAETGAETAAATAPAPAAAAAPATATALPQSARRHSE